MEMREEGGHVSHDSSKYAKKGTANTAMGLAIGALGLQLLSGNSLLGGLTGNVNGCAATNCSGPTAFEAWEKSCNDALALQAGIYNNVITAQNTRFNDRQVIDKEMFGLYKSQIDADFNLYKGNRDGFDILNNKISDLEKQVAVCNAIRPYQDKLIMCEINDSRKDASYNLDRRTCRMITGELVLPSTPTVTGFPSFRNCWPTMAPEAPAAA